MPLPKTILVPTDFGEPSEAALDYALDLARLLGAEIVLFHAYEVPILGAPDGLLMPTSDLGPQLLASANVGLAEQRERRAGAGVPIRTLAQQGAAAALVDDAAREVGAELVVMGTHGRTGLPRALLGSVAEKVVRTAHVPVLTVHVGDRGAEAVRTAPASRDDFGERTARTAPGGWSEAPSQR